jgi:hypothetical protein
MAQNNARQLSITHDHHDSIIHGLGNLTGFVA